MKVSFATIYTSCHNDCFSVEVNLKQKTNPSQNDRVTSLIFTFRYKEIHRGPDHKDFF